MSFKIYRKNTKNNRQKSKISEMIIKNKLDKNDIKSGVPIPTRSNQINISPPLHPLVGAMQAPEVLGTVESSDG